MARFSPYQKQIIFILALALTWAALFLTRSHWYQPWCAVTPTPCLKASVNPFDQLAFHFGSIQADFASNVVQNSVGTLAFLLPLLAVRSRSLALRIFLMLVLATAMNGAILEFTRSWVQRPRPLVFNDPAGEGPHVYQYTSFYSGHTSFVALATLGTYFWVRDFVQKAWAKKCFLMLFFFFTLITGCLRVWGGRHFPTDVIAGAIAGSCIGYLSYRLSFGIKK